MNDASENLSTIRRIALNLLKQEKTLGINDRHSEAENNYVFVNA